MKFSKCGFLDRFGKHILVAKGMGFVIPSIYLVLEILQNQRVDDSLFEILKARLFSKVDSASSLPIKAGLMKCLGFYAPMN